MLELHAKFIFFRPTNESNFRTAAYEALTAYVSNSAYDTIQIVQQVLITMLTRMEQLLGVTVSAPEFHQSILFSVCCRTNYWALMIAQTGTSFRVTCAAW